jgi:NhaA family Na+:H+ antiporter
METRHIYPLEPLFGRVITPFERFLRRTTAGGIVLIGTTVITLALAVVLGDDVLHRLWETPLTIAAGERYRMAMSWQHWVNDGLMALFFLLVGLELKREVLVGELSSLKDAALPIAAAIGGMVVPGLIYAAFNANTPTASGWGIPMATDIAFAIGILVLLAWRIPKNLIIFLTALAIADDLGAVLVIAVFYTADLDLQWLTASAVLFGALVLLNRGGIRNPLPYALLGIVMWFAVHASGVHATLAGILLALTIPARPTYSPAHFQRRIGQLHADFVADRLDLETPDDPLSNHRMASIAEAMEYSAAAVQSPLQRIEHGLTPWVTFVIIPIFALANAGIDLTSVDWTAALANSVTVGVLAGLVLGKFAGISVFSWVAVRLGLARLPSGVEWKHLLGAAWLGGIGFTMSLFIAQLAFREPLVVEQAKLGILLASGASAAIGLTWLLWASAGLEKPAPQQDESLADAKA